MRWSAEVTAWQSRPLEPMYPVVFFDALRVKIRDEASCATRRCIWRWACCPMARATCWACGSSRPKAPSSGSRSSTSCRSRGVNDILIAVVDGLKGLAEAIETAFPQHDGADLHRAPDPQQPGLRGLEGSQGGGRGAATDLHGGHRRGGRKRRWRSLQPATGARSIRRSCSPGGGPGSTSSRSSPSRRRSAG